jgi:hypothetical protein
MAQKNGIRLRFLIVYLCTVLIERAGMKDIFSPSYQRCQCAALDAYIGTHTRLRKRRSLGKGSTCKVILAELGDNAAGVAVKIYKVGNLAKHEEEMLKPLSLFKFFPAATASSIPVEGELEQGKDDPKLIMELLGEDLKEGREYIQALEDWKTVGLHMVGFEFHCFLHTSKVIALKILYRYNIVHLDVKPENIA